MRSPRLDQGIPPIEPQVHTHIEAVLAMSVKEVCIYRCADKILIVTQMFQIYHLLNVTNLI